MKKPTYRQAAWLKRIAASFLMVTRSADREPSYSLEDGTPVPTAMATRLIKNGWLKPQQDGLFEEPQTYRARTP